jgi:hypothetical protein
LVIAVGDRSPATFVAPDGLAPVIASLAHYARTFYFVGNHICDIDDDAAKGETYTLAHHYEAHEGHASVETVIPIRYQDRYVRTDEGWKSAPEMTPPQRPSTARSSTA